MKIFKHISFLFILLTCISTLHAQNIVITEISYNPAESGSDSTEYIELYNNTSALIDLTAYTFVNGIVFTFPAGATIEAGGYVVVAVNAQAVMDRYGITGVYEWTSGGLSNGGEPISLRTSDNVLVDSVRYDDATPWPTGTESIENPDGGGPSIVLCDPDSDNLNGANWTESQTSTGLTINSKIVYGSPGSADAACASPCPSTFAVSACDSYTVPSGDESYTQSGTYMDTITGTGGCDSIMTITVTINSANTGTDIQSSCGPYTWIDGNTYTESNNTATHTLQNAAGCDSVVTLDLTVNNPSSSIDEITTCDSIVWLDGETYTQSTSGVTYTTVNAYDCDSVITLELTILNSTSSTDTQIACGSYTWIDGETYTESTTTPFVSLQTWQGCDSVITLNLVVKTVDVTTTVDMNTISATTAGGTYQWINCDNENAPIAGETNQSFTATENGNYAVIITENDCTDTSECVNITSIHTLDLENSNVTIYPNPSNGFIHLEFDNINNTSIEVVNTMGQTVVAKTEITSTIHEFTLNQKAGIYFIKVNSNNNISYIKIIKK